MTILHVPRLLLIAGTGRNSGKTTFACQVIRRHCNSYPITAIKISSHFHSNVMEGNTLINRPDLFISEETNRQTSKDSSLMLQAGAQKSYFVMAADEQLHEAFRFLYTLIPDNSFIICESGGLRDVIKPGIFLLFHNKNNLQMKSKSLQYKLLCNRWITFDGSNIDFDISSLLISQDGWALQQTL